MEKIILTGATGLIGSELNLELEKKYKVIILNRENCDLFDSSSIKNFLNKNNAKYLIHLAWNTKDDYLTSIENFKYEKASKDIIDYFQGEKLVFAGTCFEYDLDKQILNENDKLNPKSTYAKTKVNVYNYLKNSLKERNIDYSYCRIFYTFGKKEHRKRLVPFVIDSLKNKKEVTINSSYLKRDYMYAKDVARAFFCTLESKENGTYNISSGKGIEIGFLAQIIAKKMNKEKYLILKNESTTEPITIIGDNKKLKNKTNFIEQYSLDEAIDEVLEYNERLN